MMRALVLSLVLPVAALEAQQHPLVGSWQLSYPAGLRIENGGPTVLMANAALTVESQADSLVATLVTEAAPDLPARPPLRLAARAQPGDVTFVSQSKATLNMNGQEREATVMSTWILRATGDSLEGTVERVLEGFAMGNQGPKPLGGTRRKG